MKKTVIFLLLFFCCLVSNAQFKPESKTVTAEFQYSPLKSEVPLNGLKFKYFLSDAKALTLRLAFNMDATNEINPFNDVQGNEIDGKLNHSQMGYMLTIGTELHKNRPLLGSRLDVFIGFDLGVGQNFVGSSYEDNTGNNSIIVNNALYNFEEQKITDQSFWALQIGTYLGIDFYVYQGLYVGMNLGLNILYTNSLEYSIDEKKDGIKKSFSYKNTVEHSNINLAVCPLFHLGWKF